jgi:DNA-binding XRE family transcriptional regulator
MEVKEMCNRDLRDEMRIANVRQWEVAEAIGVSEMTMVKWLRKELDDSKKALVREGIGKAAQHKQNT